MHAAPGTGRLIAGRYRLQGPIGRGAMGIVWRGRDELLARDVAIKEVHITSHAEPAEAEALYQRTLREARTAARLNHPSVVTVYDVVEENGSPWIVMELVEARSLDRVITEDGPLPPLQAAELGASLVSALATAHSAGVLHRDVKPSNVLVTNDGRAVLTDFGIAMFAEDPSMTQAGMVVGTPGFTAPERIRGDVASAASDLWSLGATLYTAVEGRGPFDRIGGSSVISAGVAAEDAPRAPSAGPLGPVIDALLSRDPGTRPNVTTAARLLAEAATAARTGERLQGERLLAAEAGGSDRGDDASGADGAADSDAAGQPGSTERRLAAILSPPVFADLAIPSLAPPVGIAAGPAGQRPVDDVADVAAFEPAGMAAGGLRSAVAAPMAAGDNEAPTKLGSSDGGPVLWQPIGPGGAPPPGGGRPSGGAGGGGPFGAGASGDPARRWRSSGRWRLMVAGIGIAAIVIAAVIGWNIYSHSRGAAALNSAPGGVNVSAPGGGGGNSPGAGKKGASGGTHSGGPTSGASGSAGSPGGHPTTDPSGRPSGGSPSPSNSPSGSPTPSPTTTSPSPSPSTTPPVLPAGYKWHKFSPLVLGSTAGFKIGMPDTWTQSIGVLLAHLNLSARDLHLTVGLDIWSYAKPLAQAQYLYNLDRVTYHKFKLQTLGSVQFSSIGGYKSASAAELKFSWTRTTGGSFTELVILVTLNTKLGPQPYTFTLWAPSASYNAAHSVFHTAIPTFRPLTS